MDDKTLLRRAAKAAGYRAFEYCEPNHEPALYVSDPDLGIWMPLADDGDALRLAVKLGLTVCNEHATAGAAYCTDAEGHEYPVERPLVDTGEEITDADYAATRRAIVRAAAALGGE